MGFIFHFVVLFSLLLPLHPVFANEQALSLYVDSKEGGEISKRRLDKLKLYLQAHQCNVQQAEAGKNNPIEIKSDLIISPLQLSFSNKWQQLAGIRVINDEPLSGSILVRGSTGINNVSSLEGVRIAFLSSSSLTGYDLQQKIFKKSDIKHDKNNITFAHTNIAATSLLLHKDVFAAGIATPLANKWAPSNNLIIVATSDTIETGGIWANKGLSKQVMNHCISAFTKISSTGQKNKKLMRLFPAWLDSFFVL